MSDPTGETLVTSNRVPDNDSKKSSKVQNGGTVKSFFTRLRKDADYRMKFIDTVWLWWSFFAFGWCYTLIGPTLPDLQLLVDVDLKTAAWLITSSYFGYMLGCLVFGFLDGRVHRVLLLSISVFGLAVSATVTPWCPWYWLMLIVRVFCGFFFGGIDTCCHSRLFSIWKADARSWLQVMYFHFSSGGLLAPLATEPFLAPLSSNETTQIIIPSNTTTNATSPYCNFNTNCTVPNPRTVTAADSRVQYAYLIIGIVSFVVSIPLILSYLICHRHESAKNESGTDDVVRKTPSRGVFYLVICLMSLFFVINTGWIETFSSMMMSFSLYHIKWTKQQGALINSMMWIAYAAGNFVCIFLVQFLSTATLLMSFVIGATVGVLGMVIGSKFLLEPLIWLSVIVTGFFMSILWPASFQWTEETVTPVSGRVASLFLISGSVGFMMNSPIVATLMEDVEYMWYTYFHLMEGVILFVLFLTCILLYKRLPEPEPKATEEKDENEMKLLSLTEITNNEA